MLTDKDVAWLAGYTETAIRTGKRLSMRTAIDLKCKDCIFDPLGGGGTWRQQVEACTVTECPLWLLRTKSRPRRQPETEPAPSD